MGRFKASALEVGMLMLGLFSGFSGDSAFMEWLTLIVSLGSLPLWFRYLSYVACPFHQTF